MSISFDKRNQRWRYHFDRYYEGQRKRASRLLPKGWTQAEARKYDDEENRRLSLVASGVVKPEPLIDDAVLLYLKHKKHLKSFANIERELAACSEIYMGKPFSALAEIASEYKPVRIKEIDGKKVEAPLAPATVKNRLSYIRAACRYAWKKHKMGEHDPAERVEMPVVRNKRHVYLNRAQFLEICRAIPPGRARAGVRIAFYSGMRAGELLPSKIFDLGGTQVFLMSDSKNGEPRAVPIHPRIAHIVRNSKLWPVYSKWNVSKAFKAAARAAGYGHARLHDMRHSTASEMINGGADLYTVGGVLGHKSPVSTQRYAHLVTGRLQAALALVGKNPRTTGARKAA